MNKVLPQNFFNRPTIIVAQELLGKFLVRKYHGKNSPAGGALMITEVEAYDGFNDKASHASAGKTKRNKIMFGEAGKWYVYFTYGMHWMLNIVVGPKNYPAAILIRSAVFEKSGRIFSRYRSAAQRAASLAPLARSSRRTSGHHARSLAEPRCENIPPLFLNGPAKLTKFLKIDKKFNGKPANKKTKLWIEDRGVKISKAQIAKRERVGVDYAGKWANKLYRFMIK